MSTIADADISSRFWAKVRKTETCWLWTASRDGNGYGQFVINRRKRTTHRVAYELLTGSLPEGLQLSHLCHNRTCVNPAHLVDRKAAKTHCKHGHPFDEINTRIEPDGRRGCRACSRRNTAARSTKRYYKLSQDDYLALLSEQGDRCAICRAAPSPERRLRVDHDHRCCPGSTTCGSCVRGLLCQPCNHLLGSAKDDIATLQAAITYLQKAR